jgi:1-deoxyxylulose-5-phosphate synthase
LGFLPWGTLARGMATDRYLDMSKVGPGDRLYDEGEVEKVRNERSLGIVRTLQKIGVRHEKTVAQTALAYLLSQPGMGAVIPSASSVEQLEANCGATGYRLSEAELGEIEAARAREG